MHRLMAGVTILEHELSELRLLVERQTGILLDCPNSALAAHVAEYLETHELESPAALLARLRCPDLDPAMLAQFLDGVLNVNTGFFRHPGAMNALARGRAAVIRSQIGRWQRHSPYLERRLWHGRRTLLDRHGPVRSDAPRERQWERVQQWQW